MPISGSTTMRRQLGRQLQQLRDAARKTEMDVVEANLVSRVKLWRIETGKGAVKTGDVRGLCQLYGADRATTDALTAIAAASAGQEYWEDHNRLREQSWLYAGLESAADEIRIYEPSMVPDLLQTSHYVRAIRRAIDPDQAEKGLQERIELHMERQEAILARPSPPRLTVVLDAGVRLCRVGGGGVMAEQVSWLRELNRSDHIDIRVLPREAGAHPAIRIGAFTILDFHHEEDPAVVHVESLTGARYTERADEVDEYRRMFRRLYEMTVGSRRSQL